MWVGDRVTTFTSRTTIVSRVITNIPLTCEFLEFDGEVFLRTKGEDQGIIG